ncbi:MAG: PAS domain-containing protein [Roseobacter sp.]
MFEISDSYIENNKIPLVLFDPKSRKILAASLGATTFFDRTHDAMMSCDVDELMRPYRATDAWDTENTQDDPDLHLCDASYENQSAKLLTVYGTLAKDPVRFLAQDTQAGQSRIGAQNRDMLNARLKQVQSLARIGYWEMDLSTRKMRRSPEIYDIFRMSRGALEIGIMGAMPLVHPEDQAALNEKINRVLSNREPYASVHRIQRGDGTIGYIREVGEVFGEDSGVFHGITQDVTDVYLAQAEVEHATQVMADASQLAKVGGWSFDVATGLFTRSVMVAQIMGQPNDLVVNLEQAQEIYTSRYQERFKEVWENCLTNGQGFNEVMEILSREGMHKWVRFVGRAVWSGGSVTGIRGALQDISDVVAARQQTEAMSTRLEETLEGISDSFMILNRDWEVTFANDSATKLMQRPKSEMLGNYLWSLFPEAARSEFRERYEHLMKTGETQRFTARSPRSHKWLAVTAYATKQGLAISSRDVTAEHIRDQQLRLLETAVARLNDIVMISETTSDSDGGWDKFVFANEAFEQIMGYSAQEIIGQTSELLRGPETQQDVIDEIRDAIERKRPLRCEIINYTKAGQRIWLELDIVPIKQETGHVSHWVSVSRDITERKAKDERLRLSEERFRLVAGASSDVIWDCDLQSGEMWWNEQLLNVFGYDAADFNDKLTWWDANIHPDEQVEILQRMQSIIDGNDTAWELKYRFKKVDGSYAYVHDCGAILRDEMGSATRILGSMTDVTDQLHLEERLRQSQKIEAIGKLTGGVAHDFNNLLAIIMGNLELLKEEMRVNDGAPDDAFELIDAGIAAVKRGSGLTNQMLSYARKARLDPVDTDINQVVQETKSWVRRTIDSGIEIKTELASQLWSVCVDPNSLQSAIVNLLLNARDALGDGGKIVISTSNVWPDDPRIVANKLPAAPHGYVMLSVTDNGDGIATPDLNRVFDPFFTTKPIGQGSGLGLSMVQGFVSQSDGAIRVFSEPGQGTRLELYFKSERAPVEILSTEQKARESVGLSICDNTTPKRILIAEDDPDVQRMLKRSLTNNGYDVVTADSGDAALDIFKTGDQFDLLLTDVSMPGSLDGFDLARLCRRIRQDVPIVFLSGHASENTETFPDVIADALRLMKPVSQHDLLKAIEQSIKGT